MDLFEYGKEKNVNHISEFLKLDKPLVIFDLETTGLNLTLDKIIEIAYVKIYPDGKKEMRVERLNPQMKITKEAAAVHGITDADVRGKPTFADLADEFLDVFRESDLSGFNIVGFDLPMMEKEFEEAGKHFDFSNARILDGKVIFHAMEPRTLSAAYRFYCGKDHADAHSALADVEATAEVIGRQLEKYADLRDWGTLAKLHEPTGGDRFVDPDKRFYWRDGHAYFNFGKYRDEALRDISLSDPGFLEWILGADFSKEVKEIVMGALAGRFPEK